MFYQQVVFYASEIILLIYTFVTAQRVLVFRSLVCIKKFIANLAFSATKHDFTGELIVKPDLYVLINFDFWLEVWSIKTEYKNKVVLKNKNGLS